MEISNIAWILFVVYFVWENKQLNKDLYLAKEKLEELTNKVSARNYNYKKDKERLRFY